MRRASHRTSTHAFELQNMSSMTSSASLCHENKPRVKAQHDKHSGNENEDMSKTCCTFTALLSHP